MSSTTVDGSSENQLMFSKSNQSFEKVKFTRSYRSRSMTQEQINGLNSFSSKLNFFSAEIEEYEAERLLSKDNDHKEDLV